MILNRYYIEVYEQRGGCLPRLVPLEELNTLISAEENALIGSWKAVKDEDGNSHATITSAIKHIFDVLIAQIAAAYTATTTQGFAKKLEAIATRADTINEALSNKRLVLPIINDNTGAQAYYDIGLADTTGNLRLTYIDPGTAGNAIQVLIGAASGINQPTTITWDTPNLGIALSTDGDGVENATCYELARSLLAVTGFSDTFIITYNTADANKLVKRSSGSFAHGAEPIAALTSNSAEIDAVVANAPEVASVPTMAQTYATGRLTFAGATNPTDGDTITVGSKTYTFRDALAGGGQANEILICATNVPDDTCLAIQYAINASTGEGHTAFYGTGTTANQDVVATAGDNIVDLTCEGSANAATLLGTAGNAVVTTVSAGLTEAAFGSAHLTGGLDITAADAGKIIVGSSGIYVAKAQCTASSSNWETISYDV